MRKILIVILVLSVVKANGQEGIIGSYTNHFGSRLLINADSTFDYNWRFDLTSSWTVGKWNVKGDTLLLEATLIYDTVTHNGHIGPTSFLVLSTDRNPEEITFESYLNQNQISATQNQRDIPTKLLHDNDRLYLIDDNGKMIKRKARGIWTKKRYPTWYNKEVEKK